MVGSYGCFGLSGKYSGNKGAKKFISDLTKRLEQNKKAKKGTDINVNVKKRKDVQWNFEVNKDGEVQ